MANGFGMVSGHHNQAHMQPAPNIRHIPVDATSVLTIAARNMHMQQILEDRLQFHTLRLIDRELLQGVLVLTPG